MSATSHFSAKSIRVKKNVLKCARDWASECPVLEPASRALQEDYDVDFCFTLCEGWKILQYVRCGDVRYLRRHDDEDPAAKQDV